MLGTAGVNYGTQNGASGITAGVGPIYASSSSTSYTKLNKSANNIQATVSNIVNTIANAQPISGRKNDSSSSSLSQQLINSLAKANNMSPSNKKLLQQMV